MPEAMMFNFDLVTCPACGPGEKCRYCNNRRLVVYGHAIAWQAWARPDELAARVAKFEDTVKDLEKRRWPGMDV